MNLNKYLGHIICNNEYDDKDVDVHQHTCS